MGYPPSRRRYTVDTQPIDFDQLDSIDRVLIPYQHSAEGMFIEHSLHRWIPRQLPGLHQRAL